MDEISKKVEEQQVERSEAIMEEYLGPKDKKRAKKSLPTQKASSVTPQNTGNTRMMPENIPIGDKTVRSRKRKEPSKDFIYWNDDNPSKHTRRTERVGKPTQQNNDFVYDNIDMLDD